MTLEWDVLTWKQKKAVKLSLKTNNERISLNFLDGIYSDEDRARNAIKTLNNNGIIEKSNIGNKYTVNKENIPEEEQP